MSKTSQESKTHTIPSWHPEVLKSEVRKSVVEIRQELLRVCFEKRDGLLTEVSRVFDGCWRGLESPQDMNASELDLLRTRFQDSWIHSRLSAPSHFAPGFEIIPQRSEGDHLVRRTRQALVWFSLNLRAQAHQMTLKAEQKLEMLRCMLKVQATDSELKGMFSPGIETPMAGRRFGGKGFRSTWQEAIVGVGFALQQRFQDKEYRGDVAAPLIRDLGVGLAMGYDPAQVMAAQLGTKVSPMAGVLSNAGGRDLHWGDLNQGLLVATAPLAVSAATLTGLALKFKHHHEQRVCVSFIGEGGSSQGDWYEALNFAGVRKLPMIIFVENNRVALGTAVERQSAVDLFADKAVAAGIPSLTIDGTDPEALYAVTRAARDFALWDHGGPVLIGVEAMRGCGHAHHDDERYRKVDGDRVTGYVDEESFQYWQNKEPISNYCKALVSQSLLSLEEFESLKSKAQRLAKADRAKVEAAGWTEPATLGRHIQPSEHALTHQELAAQRQAQLLWPRVQVEAAAPQAKPLDDSGWTYRVAIEEALSQAAQNYGEDFLMLGEDLEYGGAFGVTRRLKSRGLGACLVDTPLAESVIVAAGVGASLAGLRVVCEIQFNAFAAHGFSQIVNNAATIYWRYGRKVPLVIRIPVGAGLAGGPYHALSNEAWFTSTPGLRLLYPATPSDAYHGLLEAIEDPAPVLFFEHLTLYPPTGRTTAFGFPVRQMVDQQATEKVLGEARCVRRGQDLTIVTYGAMVHFATHAAELLEELAISVEILDLRSLWPLDLDACVQSVERTHALIVLHEAQSRGGYGHYICQRLVERCFMVLAAPPLVLGSMDTLPPFAPHLEAAYLPSFQSIANAARDLVAEKRLNS